MAKSGLSKARLARMHDLLAGYVERNELPGLVTVVARHGEAHIDAIGKRSVDQSAPMKRDTIFRIASMTKPITAVATLILIEECRLRLDEPVDPYLPELADRRVLRTLSSALDDTVPANRAITVRDLLTFTFGFGSVMAMPGTYPIQNEVARLKLGGDGPPLPALAPRNDDWMRNLGSLPLIAQPGEQWLYNTGSDVLGVLISRVTGQSFEAFLQERIFGPLGMKDTSFTIPKNKLDRFTSQYGFDYAANSLTPYDGIENSAWSDPDSFQSGAGGLVSTAEDFLTFSQFLLNFGKHGNERIVSRLAIETMTTDQLTPAQRTASHFIDGFFESNGWGFGVSIARKRDDISTVPGMYGWTGGLGTTWTNDPHEDMIVILLTQRLLDSPAPLRHFVDFRTLAYAAIDD